MDTITKINTRLQELDDEKYRLLQEKRKINFQKLKEKFLASNIKVGECYRVTNVDKYREYFKLLDIEEDSTSFNLILDILSVMESGDSYSIENYETCCSIEVFWKGFYSEDLKSIPEKQFNSMKRIKTKLQSILNRNI